MERLKERLVIADRALRTLEALLQEGLRDAVARDAAIQRFEYSFEAVWKAQQRFLADLEGLEVGSPKGVVRAAFQVGLLGEQEAARALALVDDRNLTVHSYDEELAESLAARLPGHAALLRTWLDRARQRSEGKGAQGLG